MANVKLLPQDSTDLRSIYLHRIFHQLLWKLPWKSIFFHGSFHGRRRKNIFTSIEISSEADGSRFTSMQVSGSFHGSPWSFPMSVEVEASIAPIKWSCHGYYFVQASMSFHISLSTATYFHEYHKLSAACTRPTQTLTLTKTPTQSWSYLHRGWPTSNFHGSTWKYTDVVCCFQGSWSYLHASWSTSNFHGSWWKLPWKQM